jgi:dihydroneopterin aldolase
MSDHAAQSLLANTRRLFLRDLVVDANIGIHHAEREGAQRIVLNIDVYVALARSTPRHDSIDEVLDYDVLSEVVRGRLARGHINLQETLVDDLAAAILALDRGRIVAVRVQSEKPDIYPDVAGVGVEVLRMQDGARE